jgi:hypothetical protein
MKLKSYEYPHSSFLSVEKDLDIITSTMMKNERFKKLLYYTTPDALERSNLSSKETAELFSKNIKIVPKLYVDGSVLAYVIINFDNFVPNASNPEFRDNVISFDIICHFDQWDLNDFKLRPYKIAAEIDTMFNNKHLTGIGELQFLGANQIILTDEFAGLSVMYAAIHGEDDKKNMLNPQEQTEYNIDFNKLFNS